MKTSRAILLMLAGLAAGTGIRVAFSWPDDKGRTHVRPRAETKPLPPSQNKTNESQSSIPRPAESEILAARGGQRLRLLVKWLAGADAAELRLMVDSFVPPQQEDIEDLPLRLLLGRWAEVDPRAMLEWARSDRHRTFNRNWYTDAAFIAWARLDFDSAWAAARPGPHGTKSSALMGLTFSDPGKCLRMLRADQTLLELGGFTGMDEVIPALAARNPAGVMALLDSLPAAKRLELAPRAALALTQFDAPAAVAWMTRLDLPARTAAVREAGLWIAQHAPEHVAALLQGLPTGQVRAAVEAATLSRLAAEDPDAARRQLDAMPPGYARQFGRGVLMTELFRRGDEAAALAEASRLEWTLSGTWNPAWSGTVSNTARVGSHDLYQDETAAMRDTMQELLGRLAARDPQQALAVLARTGEEFDAGMLLAGKKNTRPAALAEALLAAGDTQSVEQFKTLASNWKDEDPAAAASWALTHGGKEAGEILDRILEQGHRDPASTFVWAARLTPEQRLPLLLKFVGPWQREGDVDVAEAIAASTLPEAEKQQLTAALEQGGEEEKP